MNEKLLWILISLMFLFIAFVMVCIILSYYMKYSERYRYNSKAYNLKLALRDFFNRPGNSAFAAVLSAPIIISFIYGGELFAVIIPLIVLKILCIISGLIFAYYFIQSFFNTIKSIKKERFKTTIKATWQGVLAFFVFAFFVFAYVTHGDSALTHFMGF